MPHPDPLNVHDTAADRPGPAMEVLMYKDGQPVGHRQSAANVARSLAADCRRRAVALDHLAALMEQPHTPEQDDAVWELLLSLRNR